MTRQGERAEAPVDEPGFVYVPPAPRVDANPPTPAAAICATGDVDISEGACVRETLLARGPLRVGRNARIAGNLMTDADADVGEGVRVDGELRVAGCLRWGLGASARGVVTGGPLVTDDGCARAASIVAREGIASSGDATGGA